MDTRGNKRTKSRHWGIVAAGILPLVAVLAACSPPSGSLRAPGQAAVARTAILKRIHNFRALEAVVSATARAGSQVKTATAVIDTAGPETRAQITTTSGTLLEVDDGTNAWTYDAGSQRYAIGSSLAPSGFDLRWLTSQLGSLVGSVRFTRVSTGRHGDWRIQWRGRVPVLGAAQGLLVFDPRLGVPTELVIQQPHDQVELTVRHYVVNPVLPARTFSFIPPAGTSSLDTQASTLLSLDHLAATLSFAVLVPTSRSGLTLTQVSVAASSLYGPEVMMEFEGNSGPLLMTEYQDATGAPPPNGAASYAVAVGSLTITITDLPVTGVYATAVDGHTALVVEGSDAEVMQALGNLPPPALGSHQLG